MDDIFCFQIICSGNSYLTSGNFANLPAFLQYLLNSCCRHILRIIYICSLRHNRKRRYGSCHSNQEQSFFKNRIHKLPPLCFLIFCNCYRIVTYVTFVIITLQHVLSRFSLIIIHLIFDLYLLFVTFCYIHSFILTKYIIRIILKAYQL